MATPSARLPSAVPIPAPIAIPIAMPATLMPFFVQYVLKISPIWTAALIVVYLASGVICLPLWVRMARRFGKLAVWLAVSAIGVTGGAIATSSLLYLVLPVIMGLLLRFTRLSLGWATLIFVPLVGVVIWIGQYLPLDLGLILQSFQPNLTLQEADFTARKVWDVLLLAYCLVAGVVPVWMLLQPRGHLGGFFLYAALAAGAGGCETIGSAAGARGRRINATTAP